MTDDLLLEDWIKHTLHRTFDILNRIVNDTIQTDINLLTLCNFLRLIVRTNIKSNDDRITCRSKNYITLIDCTNTGVDTFNCHFLVGKLKQALLNSLYRTLYICLDDKVQILYITFLNPVIKVIERHTLLCICNQFFLATVDKCLGNRTRFLLIFCGNYNLSRIWNAI